MKKRSLMIGLIYVMLLHVTAFGQEFSPVNSNTETEPIRTATTYAYCIGGINADGDDFTPTVNYSYSLFNSMSSVDHAYKNTTPSYSYISGNNPGGYKRIGSYLVLLTGHANNNVMYLDNDNGNTMIGIYKTSTCYDSEGRHLYGLNNVSMSHTDLILFFGCRTAAGYSNLCTKSVDKGAKAAVGTTGKVYTRTADGQLWIKRFLDGLYSGKSVNAAFNYADGFVASTCTMRKYRTCIGNSSVVINSGGATLAKNNRENNVVRLDPSIVEKEISIPFQHINSLIDQEKAEEYAEQLSEVVQYLRTIDPTFNLKHYRLSVRMSSDSGERTVDLSYFIGEDIATDRGFIFAEKEGILNRVVYNKDYYENEPEVDEAELIKLVEEDLRTNPLENIVRPDYEKTDNYSYSYRTGELKRLTGTFRLKGECWVDNAEERVLN